MQLIAIENEGVIIAKLALPDGNIIPLNSSSDCEVSDSYSNGVFTPNAALKATLQKRADAVKQLQAVKNGDDLKSVVAALNADINP